MTETPTEPAVPETSPYAQELVDMGARPSVVTQDDLDAMRRQLQVMQDRVRQLEAERGVPLDKVDGYRKHLHLHFAVRKNGRPDVDFTPVENAIATLPDNPDDITSAQTEYLHSVVGSLLQTHPGKELDYLGVLTGELHQEVLLRNGTQTPHSDRIAALEMQVAKLTELLKSQAGA